TEGGRRPTPRADPACLRLVAGGSRHGLPWRGLARVRPLRRGAVGGPGSRLLAAFRGPYNAWVEFGEGAEWPIGSGSKTADGLARPRLRIPPSPLPFLAAPARPRAPVNARSCRRPPPASRR